MSKTAKTPKLRFKGFTDAWEQCTLGSITEITMGQSPRGETYSTSPSKYILVQGNADIKNGWVVPRIWTTEKTKLISKGDILMSVRAPVGSVGQTRFDAVIGRGIAGIKGDGFIFQVLSKMDSDSYWKNKSCGSTFESINSNEIKSAELIMPTKRERNKIGCFFTKLDSLITLHQRKLEKLQIIKKSLLEKMFV